jgi:uncharacterized protein (DUF488 family)
VLVCTLGHGTRPLEELVEMLHTAGVSRLVDVRRFPVSRRNPQFGQETLRDGKLYLCGSPVGERPSDLDRLIQRGLFEEGSE